MSLTVTKRVSANELLAMPDDGYRYELVKGELVRFSHAECDQGRFTMNLAAPLHAHVKANRLGVVCAAETGFVLARDPDTVRAPDISFVGRAKYEKAGPSPKFWDGAPDLAVEVLSPSDSVPKVKDKVAHWIEAGAQQVWIVSPKDRTVSVYRSLTEVEVLTENDQLSGGELVPGFEILIAEIFAD